MVRRVYRRERRLSFDVEKLLNAAIESVDKLHELWMLYHLVQTLEEVLNEPARHESEFPHQISFANSDTVLHYNRPLPEYSRYLQADLNDRGGRRLGLYRPDYALAVWEEIHRVGDTKSRPLSNVSTTDYQAMPSYVEDLAPH